MQFWFDLSLCPILESWLLIMPVIIQGRLFWGTGNSCSCPPPFPMLLRRTSLNVRRPSIISAMKEIWAKLCYLIGILSSEWAKLCLGQSAISSPKRSNFAPRGILLPEGSMISSQNLKGADSLKMSKFSSRKECNSALITVTGQQGVISHLKGAFFKWLFWHILYTAEAPIPPRKGIILSRKNVILPQARLNINPVKGVNSPEKGKYRLLKADFFFPKRCLFAPKWLNFTSAMCNFVPKGVFCFN